MSLSTRVIFFVCYLYVAKFDGRDPFWLKKCPLWCLDSNTVVVGNSFDLANKRVTDNTDCLIMSRVGFTYSPLKPLIWPSKQSSQFSHPPLPILTVLSSSCFWKLSSISATTPWLCPHPHESGPCAAILVLLFIFKIALQNPAIPHLSNLGRRV